MVEIPRNDSDMDPETFEEQVDAVCRELLARIKRQKDAGYKAINVQVTTEHCYGGGYTMAAIREAAKRFDAQGWYCYLVRGGAYCSGWQWLKVFDREHPEGYTSAKFPDCYERIR